MWLLTTLALLGASLVDGEQQQVAVLCDHDVSYHAQYLDAAGHWVSELQHGGGCLREPADLVAFCRRVYPEAEVTHVQQADDAALIDSWCKTELGQCSESMWVRPYRCLSTQTTTPPPPPPPPQLVQGVSRSCQSDQVSNASRCWDKSQWRDEAVTACEARRLRLTSLFPVYPCGADLFTGVDFECCPDDGYYEDDLMDTSDVEDDEDDDAEDEEDIDNEINDSFNEDVDDEIEDIEAEILEPPTGEPYYIKFDPREEHTAFTEAMGRLEDRYKEKSARIMDEWNQLEKRYQNLKKTDDTKAEEFKLKMTDRFQRLVNALKTRDATDKHTLRSLHQQRMLVHVENLKRDSIACFNRSLSAPTPSPASVHRCLSKLLRALYRDRHHTISHFQHLRATQPRQADDQRSSTIQHLQILQHNIDLSIQRLDRFPQVKFMIMPDVNQLLGGLQRRDSLPVELEVTEEEETTVPPTTTRAPTTVSSTAAPWTPRDDQLDDQPDATRYVGVSEWEERDNEAEDKPDPSRYVADPAWTKSDDQTEDQPNAPEYEADPAAKLAPHKPVSVESVSIEVHASPTLDHADHRPEPFVVHSQPMPLTHRGVIKLGGYGRGFYVSVGLTALVMVVAVVGGVLAVRRRSPHRHGFIEVEQPGQACEVHLDHMQSSGYENPTYKYFDK